MICLTPTNKKKRFEKEKQIVSMHIRSNKTHLSNLVFANLQGQVSCFHIFGPKCRTD